MAAAIANYNIKLNELTADLAVEGFQSAEVDAIMKAVRDDKTWNAIERNANLQGLCGIPTAKKADVTDINVIEMAKFSVDKYNEEAGTKLVFMKVIACASWNLGVVTVYALLIQTQDSKGTYIDKAVAVDVTIIGKKLLWYKH
ncbi:unnamed protein product [Coffea canephora]|uniref:DH200=94 genomic scaffold, scaffold_2958 n=1 Tax=Coffea canephora TaxID=49390 RepID=A0A068VNG3_COFCA|nr:unnamed protein product [Coffea canephora]